MATDPLTVLPSEEIQESSHRSPIRKARSRIKGFYEKYEKYTEMAIFGVGFFWDSLTMTRVDSVLDNIILLFYQILIGLLIILTLRRQGGAVLPQWVQKIEPRFLWIMQFCFGGLFSSYVIFYFKSASFTRTQFFFLILVGLWIGNEFLHERLKNCVLLSVLYSFCLFSFLAFFLPVILAVVNRWIFVLAGLISVVASLFVFSMGLKTEGVPWLRTIRPVAPWILGTFLMVNFLYFANLIPPVPLALTTGHIYHYAKRVSDAYEVRYVPPPFYRFWRKWDDPFYWTKGEVVYCYTAIFAPNHVRVPVRHIWSHKTNAGWKITDRVRFSINGGRDDGYRGYTKKTGVTPGDWRVEVQTESGQILGQINFTVFDSSNAHPSLRTELIH